MTLDNRKELAKQSLRLGSHAAELNRIDTAFVAAVKTGKKLPSPSKIFGALTDASIGCADVIDTYGPRPIPENVRSGLVRVHCAMSDLHASLKLYAELSAHTHVTHSLSQSRSGYEHSYLRKRNCGRLG